MRAVLILLLLAARAAADPPPIKLGGYVEVFDAYNFNRPANGVTNLRAFDDRHASITVQNAVLEGTWTHGPISGRIALQVGEAGDIYYEAEPVQPPTGSAPATGPVAWRNIQEAYLAYAAPDRIEVAAGLFLSPVGPETVAAHNVWNWSRSNLFFALPFYHVGFRVKRPLGDSGWTVIAMVANGWNNAIDNNHTPSGDVIAAYQKGDWLAQLQYFGGIETQGWRNLFDAYVQGPIAGHLSFLLHGDAGFQPGASWEGAAGYLKYDFSTQWYAAVRGDYLHNTEQIVFPTGWVTSGTVTGSFQPADGVAFRLEYRHDQAASDAYFAGHGTRRYQDTLTLGATAWF
jgi:hypothetical protein